MTDVRMPNVADRVAARSYHLSKHRVNRLRMVDEHERTVVAKSFVEVQRSSQTLGLVCGVCDAFVWQLER
jgi:hypothetical protein